MHEIYLIKIIIYKIHMSKLQLKKKKKQKQKRGVQEGLYGNTIGEYV